MAVEYGWVLATWRKKHFSLIYEDEVIYSKSFHYVIKISTNQREMTVKTIHKMDASEVRRKCRKLRIIRPHKR